MSMTVATPEAGTEAQFFMGMSGMVPGFIYRYKCHRGGGTISAENAPAQIGPYKNSGLVGLCARCRASKDPCDMILRT